MSSETRFFSAGDTMYAYKISGKGPVIVLLHGFTGSHQTWSNFVSAYQHSFQLITIDLPGHGHTVTGTPRTMETCCHDLARLLKYLQIGQIHLVGYSMGGRLALFFSLLYPHLISSLVLESASPGIESNDERKKRETNDEQLAQRIETGGVRKFVDFWEDISMFASQKKLPQASRQTIRRERLNQTKEGLATSLRFMGTGSQPSLWHKLDQLTKPVLLITGELDHKFVAINEQMHSCFINSTYMITEKSGHAIHVENPVKFGKLVTAFITKEIPREDFNDNSMGTSKRI